MSQRLSKCVVTQNQCPPPHPRHSKKKKKMKKKKLGQGEFSYKRGGIKGHTTNLPAETLCILSVVDVAYS